MKMNRRKALIGIGSLAVGSGAALGSGAFTSVEANRTVDVQTTNDQGAALGLSSDNPYVSSGGSSGTLEIDIGSAGNELNEDAITTIDDIFSISNNSADGNAKDISLAAGSVTGVNDGDGSRAGSASVDVDVSSSGPKIRIKFILDGVSGSGTSIGTSSSQSVNVEIRTGSEVSGDVSNPDEGLSIIAESDP